MIFNDNGEVIKETKIQYSGLRVFGLASEAMWVYWLNHFCAIDE
jgi:hypothetical protein